MKTLHELSIARFSDQERRAMLGLLRSYRSARFQIREPQGPTFSRIWFRIGSNTFYSNMRQSSVVFWARQTPLNTTNLANYIDPL